MVSTECSLPRIGNDVLEVECVTLSRSKQASSILIRNTDTANLFSLHWLSNRSTSTPTRNPSFSKIEFVWISWNDYIDREVWYYLNIRVKACYLSLTHLDKNPIFCKGVLYIRRPWKVPSLSVSP